MPSATAKKTSANQRKELFAVDVSSDLMKEKILERMTHELARNPKAARPRDWFMATCHAVNEIVMGRYIETQDVHHGKNVKRAYYLSLEYLMGRLLENNLVNAGLYEQACKALGDLGLDFREVFDQEVDMALGNGGLGRLAACFLDSLATLELPAIGYGIHYEFGLFRQVFINNRQVERPDNWLTAGNPWQIVRPEYTQKVRLYGHVEYRVNDSGDWNPHWVDTKEIIGVPWDIPIIGYGAKTVNFLRLWESRATEEFDLEAFQQGGYVDAVREKAIGETISKVLYPNDTTESGKELRLVQQYFFVSCSLHDIIRRFFNKNTDWKDFPKKAAIQLNDTHPAVAVPELMRILMDENQMSWDNAWDICREVFAYTNHTLLPEALEKWSVPLFAKVLPRHLQIIYEINRRFLEVEVEAKWPGDGKKKMAMSLIEEGHPKMVRMAYMSVVGGHSVNGVAALHTDLLKRYLLRNFNELYPEKFNNKTNGITPRRFLKMCNPALASLIDESVGIDWPLNLGKLSELDKYADDAAFQDRYMQVKRDNKVALAQRIHDECGVTVDPDAMFDVQIKRLHEYKRQHLNLLHILSRYRQLLRNPDAEVAPRVFIFGAKAAPGYVLAKEIIFAINIIGEKINNDPRINDKLKVVFMPNYRVSLAERIIPAADLSEQISTAGKEASGTGNMKFALNGALTIGTLDGANVEIRDAVGDENIFIFGLTVDEVENLRTSGYSPWEYYNQDDELRHVLDWLSSDHFTPGEPQALTPVRRSLLDHGDPFLVCADYRAYCEAQAEVDKAYLDKARWAKMAIHNSARMGHFSSDRTISQYAKEIWRLDSVNVPS